MDHAASTRSLDSLDCSCDAPRDRNERARVLRPMTQADVSLLLASNTRECSTLPFSDSVFKAYVVPKEPPPQKDGSYSVPVYILTQCILSAVVDVAQRRFLDTLLQGLAISWFNLGIRAMAQFPVTSSFPQTLQLHLVLLRPFQRNLLLSRSCRSPLFLLLQEKRWMEIQGDCEQESGQRKALMRSEPAKWH